MDKLNQALKDMDVTTKVQVIKRFRKIDADGSGTLDLAEFKKGFENAGMTDGELEAAFKTLDKDGSEGLNKREFLDLLMPSMSEPRKALLKEVFQSADKTGDGVISSADLSRAFASNHPDVKSGSKTVEDMKAEFLNAFEPDGAGKDGKVTYEEFEKYYTAVSQRYASDEEFINMVKGSWDLL
ncbi:crustacean calcium-binding protein 23-like [Acanthaster planci]|uniref:Crustacean calcium-binding protein 23-like n=1 Tax=Acanthaster planci TaxID=133434 RepID=A0A8B7Z9X4_ACAPL|nr:crustacean calcium-binding protein 23-like [Acanthaster planci]